MDVLGVLFFVLSVGLIFTCWEYNQKLKNKEDIVKTLEDKNRQKEIELIEIKEELEKYKTTKKPSRNTENSNNDEIEKYKKRNELIERHNREKQEYIEDLEKKNEILEESNEEYNKDNTYIRDEFDKLLNDIWGLKDKKLTLEKIIKKWRISEKNHWYECFSDGSSRWDDT